MTAGPWQELAVRLGVEVWTVVMLGLWDAGLWMLRLVLGMIDALVVPDLSADGPGRAVYGVSFWLAGALVTVLLLVQLGVAVLRRDGAALAAALTGGAKFLVVWAGWLAYCAAVVAACGGLTRALLRELLQVDTWAAWDPFSGLDAEDVTDAAVATVVGMMGLLLMVAALGHLAVMITRAGALLVLAAMTPAAAAGLVGEAGRAWFWKSLRWFHAAAFTPVLMVLMLGLGVRLTGGVVTDQTGPAAAVGTALPAVMLILVSCVAPAALFRLLAFVDPDTPSGSAARTAWAAGIGLSQLSQLTRLTGGDSGASPDLAGDNAPSTGEATAAGTTESRVVAAATGLLTVVGGPAGAAAAAGVEASESAGITVSAVGGPAGPPVTASGPAPDPGPPPPAPNESVRPAGTADRGTGPNSAQPSAPAPDAGASDAGLSGAGGTSPGASPTAGGAAADGAAARAAAVAARVPIVPV